MTNNPYNLKVDGAVISINFDDVKYGWEQWILLRADAHHDSVQCDRKLEFEHLNNAVERDALIIDFGDTFDAMQGKFDKRKSNEEIRPEYLHENYYDQIIELTAKEYGPYANRWLAFTNGNHETAVLHNANIDLLSNLIHRLNIEYGGNIKQGGYGGWIHFQFYIQKTGRHSINLKYFHGSASTNAPVTRGVIQTNRQSVYLPDADIVINGHNHQAYILPIARERLTQKLKVQQDVVWFGRIPGYKNEWGDGTKGWSVERGENNGPHPLGSLWLKFSYYDKSIRTQLILDAR
jgi:hypothetical protein